MQTHRTPICHFLLANGSHHMHLKYIITSPVSRKSLLAVDFCLLLAAIEGKGFTLIQLPDCVMDIYSSDMFTTVQ